MRKVTRWTMLGAVIGALVSGLGYFATTYQSVGGSFARVVLLPALLGACVGALLAHSWASRIPSSGPEAKGAAEQESGQSEMEG